MSPCLSFSPPPTTRLKSNQYNPIHFQSIISKGGWKCCFMLTLNSSNTNRFLKNNLGDCRLVIQSNLDSNAGFRPLDGHSVLLFKQHKTERYCPKVVERYKGIIIMS